ncbi:hypothetical protein BDN67DRAFT_984952, partial [Paxillus ammoniavirescens]
MYIPATASVVLPEGEGMELRCWIQASQSRSFHFGCSQTIALIIGWWPQYTVEITKFLWEDIGNWRSAIKKKAHTCVGQLYQWDYLNCGDVNTSIAKDLLSGGAFLKDGMDDKGHTNNLAHPTLSSLIIGFFYTGANSVGNLFPEVFKNQVPRTTVALTTTTLKVALNETAAGRKDVNFSILNNDPL